MFVCFLVSFAFSNLFLRSLLAYKFINTSDLPDSPGYTVGTFERRTLVSPTVVVVTGETQGVTQGRFRWTRSPSRVPMCTSGQKCPVLQRDCPLNRGSEWNWSDLERT